jgi:hypothetical protein
VAPLVVGQSVKTLTLHKGFVTPQSVAPWISPTNRPNQAYKVLARVSAPAIGSAEAGDFGALQKKMIEMKVGWDQVAGDGSSISAQVLKTLYTAAYERKTNLNRAEMCDQFQKLKEHASMFALTTTAESGDGGAITSTMTSTALSTFCYKFFPQFHRTSSGVEEGKVHSNIFSFQICQTHG